MPHQKPWYQGLLNVMLGISSEREKKWRKLRDQRVQAAYRRIYTPLELHYLAVLNTPFGSDFATLRTNYKALLKQYHPDRHCQSPKETRLQVELFAKAIITAYNYFEQKRRQHDYVQRN